MSNNLHQILELPQKVHIFIEVKDDPYERDSRGGPIKRTTYYVPYEVSEKINEIIRVLNEISDSRITKSIVGLKEKSGS